LLYCSGVIRPVTVDEDTGTEITPLSTLILEPTCTLPADEVVDTGIEIVPLSILIPVPIFTAPKRLYVAF